MKNTSRLLMPHRRQTGFSMVEMIGVLAIIAILAVIIVPKVFSTIASARITSAASSTVAMKTAITEFAAKYGTLPLTANTSRFDDLLIADSLIDNRFAVKIGTAQAIPPRAGGTWSRTTGTWVANGGANQTTNPAQTRLICVASAPTAVPPAAAGTNYRFDGTATNNLPAGARVVSAVIVGVTGTEAQQLSLRIDGDAGTEPDGTTADARGKVVYAAPNAATGTTVYIYLAHQ